MTGAAGATGATRGASLGVAGALEGCTTAALLVGAVTAPEVFCAGTPLPFGGEATGTVPLGLSPDGMSPATGQFQPGMPLAPVGALTWDWMVLLGFVPFCVWLLWGTGVGTTGAAATLDGRTAAGADAEMDGRPGAAATLDGSRISGAATGLEGRPGMVATLDRSGAAGAVVGLAGTPEIRGELDAEYITRDDAGNGIAGNEGLIVGTGTETEMAMLLEGIAGTEGADTGALPSSW
jgi:hypothetical protein